MKLPKKLLCYCSYDSCVNEACAITDDGACFHYADQAYDADAKMVESRHVYGCVQTRTHGGMYLQCNAGLSPHFTPKAIKCCSNEDFCNLHLNVTVLETGDTSTASTIFTPSYAWLIGLLLFLFLAFAAVCANLIFRHISRKKRAASRLSNYSQVFPKTICEDTNSDCGSDALSRVDCKSDVELGFPEQTVESGKGRPRLTEMTIAHELHFYDKLGRGRYGTVFFATWRGDNVAVKAFTTDAESSWRREKFIYETHLLQQDNILGFFGADIRSTSEHGLQMILVTQYCEHGSLHEFLKSTAIKLDQAICLARTATSGLDYLHSATHGTQGPDNQPSGKPAIAHCDIKSQNILVKRNLVCVIADFGLAVRNEQKDLEESSKTSRCFGTVRYMPPEILEQKFNRFSFDSYKLADIYSFSLVLWEIANRCSFDDVESPPYKVPYEEMIGSDPKVEDMRFLVCRQRSRPPLAEKWRQNAYMDALERVIVGCWSEKPDARLTARRIKRQLAQIEFDYNRNHSNNQKTC